MHASHSALFTAAGFITAAAGFTVAADGTLKDANGATVQAGVTRLPNGSLITTSFGSFGAVRPSLPTGTGLPRAAQFGIKVSF